jgi:hypothetical protein
MPAVAAPASAPAASAGTAPPRGAALAKAIVDTWLRCSFDGGRSQPKVDRISAFESGRTAIA